MLNVRANAYSEAGLGEPEQDANSALTELDKGLRSGKVGEQCEAIVRFPRLFEKYPFPILINSSFLKLADVFREGNNFLRLWVLRVCQQSEKHLDKILNIDEFVRRIFSVIHSNDPVARALSLRTLGSMAGIIPERQHVHHSIRRSLDSHDSVEVEAAIQAAMQFAAQSKSFALSMCNKISDMIQGLATPAHMKLQLIPILQHMHHDTSTAAMVRQLCTDLLPKYPAQEFVRVTLNTLTQLASATLVEIPDQVNLLLEYLSSDPRWAVQLAALRGLHRLAVQAPHVWPEESINKLVNVSKNSPYQDLILCVLDVLIELSKSPSVCHICVKLESSVMELCRDSSYSGNTRIAAKAIKIITQLVSYCYTEEIPVPDIDEFIAMVESLFLMVACTEETDAGDGVLKVCLQCAVSLCQCHRPLCPRFVDLIATCLIDSAATNSSNILLCEALGAIGGLEPGALITFLPDILEKICQLSDASETHTKVMLCTLVFQTLAPSQWTDTAQNAIDSVISKTNLWASYRLGRSAARYGHFRVCSHIMSQLYEQVSSENLHFWLVTLVEMSTGEAILWSNNDGLLDRLGQAVVHYSKALAAIKAASSTAHALIFQAEYIQLRCEMLQAFGQLVAACNSLCTAPPPAITAAIVQATRDDLQRFGHITNQLRKSAKEFRACGELYWKLYQSAFDADPISLTNIQILQYMCMLMAYQIDCVAQPNHQGDEPTLDVDLQTSCLETQLMIRTCQSITTLARSLDPTIKPITHQHVDILVKQVEILAKGPLCLPRYFFQVLQSTSVKLAVTPQPRVNGEWINVPSGSQLAVKVEGVILHGTCPGLFRSVSGVVLTLSSQATARPANHEGKVPDSNIVLRQSVTPHRDFFTAQFLLALGGGGQHQVVVEAAVIDKSGSIWNTGPRMTLAVKSHEEATASRNRNF
ncbi:integrator complex subunit 7-like [Lycorma delicatula]|uniref:integrator complex subunit 7-like n=1 Tax=Lycorma delicatula TaxID=130591 RepID=UPI003F50D93C